MRRIAAVCLTMALAGAGCLAGSGSRERIVRVDFQQDEFASFYWRYFPATVDAHPGDIVVFDQQWTGEPHTVTMGTIFDEALPEIRQVERRYGDLDETAPPERLVEAERAYADAIGRVPTFDAYGDVGSPSARLPCYLETGSPPRDPGDACPEREQPAFDGRQSYYSSGFIPPSGPRGNTFRVPLADDIRPGTYHFYCVIHFPYMQGRIVVKPPSAEVRSQAELNAQARKEIEALAEPLREAYGEAQLGNVRTGSERIELPLGGYHAGDEFTVQILEFVPRTISARVREPVTWTLTGAHTVSFGVPEFLPIYFVSEDGTVRRNPRVDAAAGGSPDPPPVDFTKGPYEIDGGTYDGSGFYSSGLLGSEPYARYTLRFSEPGRYRYACLVHPKMVGTLVVRG